MCMYVYPKEFDNLVANSTFMMIMVSVKKQKKNHRHIFFLFLIPDVICHHTSPNIFFRKKKL